MESSRKIDFNEFLKKILNDILSSDEYRGQFSTVIQTDELQNFIQNDLNEIPTLLHNLVLKSGQLKNPPNQNNSNGVSLNNQEEQMLAHQQSQLILKIGNLIKSAAFEQKNKRTKASAEGIELSDLKEAKPALEILDQRKMQEIKKEYETFKSQIDAIDKRLSKALEAQDKKEETAKRNELRQQEKKQRTDERKKQTDERARVREEERKKREETRNQESEKRRKAKEETEQKKTEQEAQVKALAEQQKQMTADREQKFETLRQDLIKLNVDLLKKIATRFKDSPNQKFLLTANEKLASIHEKLGAIDDQTEQAKFNYYAKAGQFLAIMGELLGREADAETNTEVLEENQKYLSLYNRALEAINFLDLKNSKIKVYQNQSDRIETMIENAAFSHTQPDLENEKSALNKLNAQLGLAIKFLETTQELSQELDFTDSNEGKIKQRIKDCKNLIDKNNRLLIELKSTKGLAENERAFIGEEPFTVEVKQGESLKARVKKEIEQIKQSKHSKNEGDIESPVNLSSEKLFNKSKVTDDPNTARVISFNIPTKTGKFFHSKEGTTPAYLTQRIENGKAIQDFWVDPKANLTPEGNFVAAFYQVENFRKRYPNQRIMISNSDQNYKMQPDLVKALVTYCELHHFDYVNKASEFKPSQADLDAMQTLVDTKGSHLLGMLKHLATSPESASQMERETLISNVDSYKLK